MTENKKFRKGRASAFNGKIIRAKDGKNPRRVGTHGHRSMEIIIGAGDRGISYEEFLAAGGRRVDLAWDLSHGAVEIA